MNDLKLFINRKLELEFLRQDILTHRTRSRLLLISASTGIGKSGLIDQLFPEFVQSNQFRVSISIDKNLEVQDGYLLKQITRLVHSNAIKNKFYLTIYQFIKLDSFYGNVASGLIKAILSFIKLNDFVDGFKEEKKDSVTELKAWLGDDNELLDVCYRYIISVSKKNNLYFTIENFQIADRTSLLLLRDLLNNTSKIYVVGECTITDEEDKTSELIKLFGEGDIDINSLRLEKLDKKELLDSIKNEKELLISIIERTYETSDGNLHKFKLLRNSSHLKSYDVSISKYDNITKHLINNLDDTSLSLIAVIQLHQGEVLKQLLDLYIEYSATLNFISKEEYNQRLLDLQQLGFLKISTTKIGIDHDSISLDLRDTARLKKIQVIAIRNWIRTYQYLERNTIPFEIDYIDNLLYQIYFILKAQSYEELPDLLEKLNKYISISPTYNIIFQLDKIADSCKNYSSEEYGFEIIKWLIVMYYRCGFGDKVVKLAYPFLLTDDTVLLCYLASLSTINHKDVFDFLKDIDGDAPLRLGLILINIRTLRSSDNFEECKKIWKMHYEKGTFKNTSFEAGFLKYCTLAEHENYDLRITCVKEAMRLFNILNDKYGQISTAIAISRDSAYIGDMEGCKAYLEKAEELANKIIFPRYQLYNNRAVLDIITGNITQLTKDGLNNSLRICSNEGDRQIILSNILVASIIEKDIVYGYTIYMKIQKEILQQFDKKDTIKHVCLYNCYRYSLMVGENENAELLLAYLYQIEIRQDVELWDYLLFDKGVNKYSNVIKKEYYPIFMLGWDIDYYIALNSYQQEV